MEREVIERRWSSDVAVAVEGRPSGLIIAIPYAVRLYGSTFVRRKIHPTKATL